MIDFRKYHEAHAMLIDLQRGVLTAESIAGADFDDPRRTAVNYLATKMLKARSGKRHVSVMVGRLGQAFLSKESAERSKAYKSLQLGEPVWKDPGIVIDSYQVEFMIELGGFGIIVNSRPREAIAA